MAKKINLKGLRKKSVGQVHEAIAWYEASKLMSYHWRRWIARMTAVEVHAAWERYAETRLVAALNHNPKHFLQQQEIVGVNGISWALARYIVRGGRRFSDFRSIDDLRARANDLIGPANNPFNAIPIADRSRIDCLAAVRNYIVHGSDASEIAYKKSNLRMLVPAAMAIPVRPATMAPASILMCPNSR